MASTGKKGKKNKGKTLALTDFLANTKRSWNDEIDEAERLIEFNRKPALPAAPRAARDIDESLIPKNPPYVAYLSNLSFEVDEKDISDIFVDLNISNVRLPREEHTDKIKGFGYVEFNDKLSFVNALHMYEVTIKGRRVRIDIADQDGDRRRGQKSHRDKDSNYDDDRTPSDWRAGPRSDYLSNDKRGSSNRRDFSFRERDGFRDKEGFRDRDRDRDGGPDRGRSFGDRETNWRDSDRRYSSDRDYRSSFGGRRNYDDRNESNQEQKTRRKLILNPRTKPIEEIVIKEEPPEPEKPSAPSAASIFGQAKPVDTAARERQIEERLAKERESVKSDLDVKQRPRGDDYQESRKGETVSEGKEKPWSRNTERLDRDHSGSREINNGQISDSEDAPNQENDKDSNRGDAAVEESEKLDYKKSEESENDKSDGEGRYGRQNRSEARYGDKYRESERPYRRDDKYRADDRNRRDKERRDYERHERGYDSEGKGRDSDVKYREQDRERDREREREREKEREREREGERERERERERDREKEVERERERERDRGRERDKEVDSRRHSERDIEARRHGEKDPEGKKYVDREGDSKRYQERDGGRYRDADDHGNKKNEKRTSASGDRAAKPGRNAPEKERLPQAKEKPKETKKPDDAPRMPKFKEAATPNYVGTNKYCCLQEDGASE